MLEQLNTTPQCIQAVINEVNRPTKYKDSVVDTYFFFFVLLFSFNFNTIRSQAFIDIVNFVCILVNIFSAVVAARTLGCLIL